MNTMQEWVTHLQNPLVLAGFGLFVFAVLLRPLFLSSRKLTGKDTAPLLNKAINFIFILSVLVIATGVVLSWKGKPGDEKAQTSQPQPPSVNQPGNSSVQQITHGDQSSAINSGGNVSVNFGDAPSDNRKPDDKQNADAVPQQMPPAQVKQETNGQQSPAINAQGDVEVNYAK